MWEVTDAVIHLSFDTTILCTRPGCRGDNKLVRTAKVKSLLKSIFIAQPDICFCELFVLFKMVVAAAGRQTQTSTIHNLLSTNFFAIIISQTEVYLRWFTGKDC
jgi:hypothetical protein